MTSLGIGGVIGVLLVIVVIAVVLWAIATYNGFVKLRNLVQESWRQVDVELQRRYDLIPNLVDTVKGYASHERNLFEEVTRARAQAAGSHGGPAERAVQEDMLSAAIGRLFAVAENYPDLRASANFASLQKELANTEDRIAAGRRFYNANVRSLNTRVETFPPNIIAGMFNFAKAEYFEVTDPQARQSPRVEFEPRGRLLLCLLLRFRRRGEAPDDAGDVLVDLVRAEREPLHLVRLGGPREHEIGAKAGLHPGDDVGIHPVPDHRRGLRMRVDPVHRRADHHRVRLAHEIGFPPRRGGDERRHRTGCGQRPLPGGTGDVGVRRNEPRAAFDEPDRGGDRLEGVGPGFPEDDVVGVDIREGVAHLVQRRREPGLPDGVRAALGHLIREEPRGGECGGPQIRLRHFQTRRAQAGGEVARGEDRVVRQHLERELLLAQLGKKVCRAGQSVRLVD